MIRHDALVSTSLAIALLFGLTGLASAQTSTNAASARSAGTTGQGSGTHPASRSPMQAPVGHFQPSPRDTPGLAREDISRTPEQIDTDKNLRICRGC